MSNDMTEGRFKAEHIDIELDPGTNPINTSSREAQRVKMYNMPLYVLCLSML